MTKTRLLTPQEYINANINRYPSLYAYPDPKPRIMDQLFNVIGNGIRDFEDAITKTRKHKIKTPPAKYTSGVELFYVYTEYKTLDDECPDLKLPMGDALDEIMTKEEAAEKYPDACLISCFSLKDFNKIYDPYPNFNKKYSLVWTDPNAVSIMSNEWKDVTAEFYQNQLTYFKEYDYDTHNYSYSVPLNDENKMQYQIKDQEKFFNRHKTENMTDEEFHAVITKEWQHPYDGDTKKFLITKWDKEQKRIITFIEETLQLVKG